LARKPPVSVAKGLQNPVPAVSTTSLAGHAGTPSGAILQHQYQDLARKLFTPDVSKLFADCTGLRFQVSWSPPPPLGWEGSLLPEGCASCVVRLGSTLEAVAECQKCLAKHLPIAQESGRKGHSFACPVGVANFWVPIHVQNVCLGIICLQAQSARNSKLRPFTKQKFNRAIRLLRLIAHDVTQTVQTEVLLEELRKAQWNISEHEKNETRLREELQQALPATRPSAARRAPEPAGQQIVRQTLEYIQENYGRPMQLKECAKKMRRNTASLSALFSQTIGLPFKRYLTELRLQKAQELLNDPSQTIAEVAYSVGYTDPNRFRVAFKQWAGLPPSAWRGSSPAQGPGPPCLASKTTKFRRQMQSFDGCGKIAFPVEMGSCVAKNLIKKNKIKLGKNSAYYDITIHQPKER
jgi:AraC-like DNA-binding protein